VKDLFQNPEQLRTLLTYVALFGIVAAVWFAAVTFWYLRRSRRVQALNLRLNPAAAAAGVAGQAQQDQRVLRLWRDGVLAGETTVVDDQKLGLFARLERLRIDAGWSTPMPRALALLALCMAAAFAAGWVIVGNVIVGGSVAAVILFGFRGYLLHCVNKRSGAFEKQLIDSLDLGARSLRAGHPLSGAFRLISEEIEAPVGLVFAEIADQESLGVSLQDALRRAADASRSPDLRIFAASVIIQLRSGGNLADMMERVTWVIRERMRLNRRARVLTAEAQMSKWVLLALPIGLFAVLNFINSKYMQAFYTHWIGQLALVGIGVMMVIGGWVMGRMAKLKY